MTKEEAIRNLVITGIVVAALAVYVKIALKHPAAAAALWMLPPPGPL